MILFSGVGFPFEARLPPGRVSGRHLVDVIERPRAGERRLTRRESPRPVREKWKKNPNDPVVRAAAIT